MKRLLVCLVLLVSFYLKAASPDDEVFISNSNEDFFEGVSQQDPQVKLFKEMVEEFGEPDLKPLRRLILETCAVKKIVETGAVFEDVKDGNLTLGQATDNQITNSMLQALCDDMNTPRMLGVLFENLSEIKQDAQLAGMVKSFLTTLMGLTLQPVKEDVVQVRPQIEQLVKQREAARAEKNWSQADELRDQLKELGYSGL